MATRLFLPRLCPSCSALLLGSGARGLMRLQSSVPGRVVVVHKTSRLDFERTKHAVNEEELARKLSSSGEDYYLCLLKRHNTHHRSLDEILSFLSSRGVVVRMRDRETYSAEDVEWADTVISAGGDGNFLFTASKVLSPETLVIGLNTDPSRSEGFLCLPHSPSDSLSAVLGRLFDGELHTIHRQRIRVTVGNTLLPVRALNEVLIGDKDHSHASYYDLWYDGSGPERQKSSGLLVYTGTGSTSWAYNVNNVTASEVQRILDTVKREGATVNLLKGQSLDSMAERVAQVYNNSNVFSGEKPHMAFSVREPIVRGIFAACKTHGYANSISVCFRSWNASMVVDGQVHYDLDYGAAAVCEILPEDALKTIIS